MIESKMRLLKEECRQREAFVARLEKAFKQSGYPLSPPAIVQAFHNHYPEQVLSLSTVRKWLAGLAYPSPERIVALAKWLGVDSVWLRYGTEPASAGNRDIIDSIQDDIVHLDTKELALVRKMIDVVMCRRLRRNPGA